MKKAVSAQIQGAQKESRIALQQPSRRESKPPGSSVRTALSDISNTTFVSNLFNPKQQRISKLRAALRKRAILRRRAALNGIVDIDIGSNDPYASDIIDNLKNAETRFQSEKSMNNMITQGVNHDRYTTLTDWMTEVIEMYQLQQQTLFLAINYLQRFFSLVTEPTSTENLQLVAAGALQLASKHEEVPSRILSVDAIVYVTSDAYTHQQVQSMELLLLRTLQFSLTAPTSVDFLGRFLTASSVHDPCDQITFKQLKTIVNFLLEISLTKYEFIDFLPSIVTAASIALARAILGLPSWCATFLHYSGYTPTDLHGCIDALNHYIQHPEKLPQAVAERYSNDPIFRDAMARRAAQTERENVAVNQPADA